MNKDNRRYIVELSLEREQLSSWELGRLYSRIWPMYVDCWAEDRTHKQVCYRMLWKLFRISHSDRAELMEDVLRLIETLPHSGKLEGHGRVVLYKRIYLN